MLTISKQWANYILQLELIWPLPLLIVGITATLNPFIILFALLFSSFPLIARWQIYHCLSKPSYVGRPLLLFLLTTILSLIASYDLRLSWPMFFTILGNMALFFAIINSNCTLQTLMKLLAMSTTLIATYFITQYPHFNYLYEAGSIHQIALSTQLIIPNWVFFVPYINAIATVLIGGFLPCFALIEFPNCLKSWGWAVCLGLISYALLITTSRGAWLSLAIVIGVWLLITIEPSWRYRLLATFFSLLVIGGLLLIWFQSAWVTNLFSTSESRIIVYRNSLNLLRDYPFTGIGVGNTFAFTYANYQLLIPHAFLYHTHNLYLSIAVGQGIFGLVAFLWLLFNLYRLIMRVERHHSTKAFRAIWLGLTAILIHGMADAPQFSGDHWSMVMLFALMGLVVKGGAELSTKEHQETSRKICLRVARWFCTNSFLKLGLIILVGLWFAPQWLSLGYTNLGSIYHIQAELTPDIEPSQQKQLKQQAINYFERALWLNSLNGVANRRQGMILFSDQLYDEAIIYLEQAYQTEANNQATLKLLGLAYTWTGQLEQAVQILHQLDDQTEIIEELHNWSVWWASIEETKYSANAKAVREMLQTRKTAWIIQSILENV